MNLLALDPSTILIIVVAGVIVFFLLILLIVIFKLKRLKNNTPAQKTLNDRELIAENAKSIDALIVLSQDNEELIGELLDLQNELKYLKPSSLPKVIDFDKAIKNKLGDLRIALTKSDGEANKKTREAIMDIKLAVADRNAKL